MSLKEIFITVIYSYILNCILHYLHASLINIILTTGIVKYTQMVCSRAFLRLEEGTVEGTIRRILRRD